MIILRYHEMPGHLAAVSLNKKSHDIAILSFRNIVKGQAIYQRGFLCMKCIKTACLNITNMLIADAKNCTNNRYTI